MPIIYQKWISRADLKANRQILYLFGDNDRRIGLGGQAKEMRGEPNAVGVRTKHDPGGCDPSFYSDKNLAENVEKINQDLEPVREHLKSDGLVVIPLDGLGTGLSAMPSMCPLTFAALEEQLEELNHQYVL